jgi:excisionase family DNA binding protein
VTPSAPTTLARLLLTRRQAAQTLAIGERTLWELTRSGAIPCLRIGRAVRYSPLDLQAWIETRKHLGSTSATQTILPPRSDSEVTHVAV